MSRCVLLDVWTEKIVPEVKIERSIDSFARFVASRRWQYAKSMPQNPHEYTVRKWVPEREEEFVEMVIFIRENGVKEIFKGRKYVCYHFNGWKYWTMGAPLLITILINRARIDLEVK